MHNLVSQVIVVLLPPTWGLLNRPCADSSLHATPCNRYDQYVDGWDTSVVVNIDGEQVRFFHAVKKGVHRVFVDHPWFLAKVRTMRILWQHAAATGNFLPAALSLWQQHAQHV